MQRILNDPDHIVDEMLEGFVKAHPDLVKTTAHPRVLAAKEAPIDGKVGVVTGGGSGHKPWPLSATWGKICAMPQRWVRSVPPPRRLHFWTPSAQRTGARGLPASMGITPGII